MIFCPAAISCIFSPEIDSDPRKSGSVGVGFTINKGVFAEVGKGVTFNGEEIRFPTVEYVLRRLKIEGVKLSSDLPLGCGFGLSGASAVATAFLKECSAIKLLDLAHEAEAVNLTGLGTVGTISFPGLVVRKNASCPSEAIVERYAWNFELDFLTIGSISTKEVLSGDKRLIREAGRKWTKEFMKKISLENLFACSKGFAKETGLIDAVSDVVEAVESYGGLASMAMLGKTIFAYNGFEALKEFGEPSKAKIDCCGVRKVDSFGNSVQNRMFRKC